MLRIACYGFCLAVGLFLARFELHTDDTGLEVFLILIATFLLGLIHPKHAWQWALLIGPWAPAADLVAKASAPLHGGLPGVAVAVILVGLIGSYSGVLVRKGIAASTAPGRAS